MIIGIDLGTTNSLVGIWRDGSPQLIPNALGDAITPSVVGLSDDAQTIITGRAARDRLLTHPAITTANFKRYMGTDHEVQLGNRKFRPEELSSLVLKTLKEDAESFLGEPVEEAIITVPAYFRDAQRKATQIAGELAGLKVERLLNEPTAAALSYGLGQDDSERTFLVFDLGGGTFDVSVLEFFNGVMEVRASAGDNRLGGEDFLDAMVQDFCKRAEVKFENLAGQVNLAALRKTLETAKQNLSTERQVEINFAMPDRKIEYILQREDFKTMCQPLLDRIREPIERAMRDARIRAAELDNVILVGGATRMSMIRDLAARLFGRLPDFSVQADEAVARGCAVQAGLKSRDLALNEMVLTDVAPFSLGIEVAEELDNQNVETGVFLPIIERNTIIPASREKTVSTLRAGQTLVEVRVFQGESRNIKDNVFLGNLKCPVPRNKVEQEQVEIRFTYDVNGLLEVEARVVSSGQKLNHVIQQTPGVMTEEEVQKRLGELSRLKIHPRHEAENIALMARAERMYEEYTGEMRSILSQLIAGFKSVLEHQEPESIKKARIDFTSSLDQLEQESPLY